MKTRYIGIRHQTKRTAEGEVRPTQVAILEDGIARLIELPDEQAELDFALGIHPIKMRKYVEGEELSKFPPYQIEYSKGKDPQPTKVPDVIDGLKQGDVVAMMLGGSGDYFAFALSKRAEETGAKVLRIQPSRFKTWREQRLSATPDDKSSDAALLAELVQADFGTMEMFSETRVMDRDFIAFRVAYISRIEAMKARIAAEQRLRQALIGRIFTDPKGLYPQGGIEKAFKETKSSDAIVTNLETEEASRLREMEKALKRLPVYTKLFANVEGVGPSIAARIIAGVGDIRRFKSDSAFIKFCGLAVIEGKFQRQRRNEILGFNPDVRQGFYLLGDQFNRRPGSTWGEKLLRYKKGFRDRHPVPVVGENNKKRYTDGHIHKMGLWRALTRFSAWLYKEWVKIEKEARKGAEKTDTGSQAAA